MKKITVFAILLVNCTLAQVGIGTVEPGSTLEVNGSAGFNVVQVASDYTLTEDDFYVLYNGTGNSTISLPEGVSGVCGCKGRTYKVINKSVSDIFLSTVAGETLDGESSLTVPPNHSVEVINLDNSTSETWAVVSYLLLENQITESSGTETKKIQVRGAYDSSISIVNGPFEFRMRNGGGGTGASGDLVYEIRPLEDPQGDIIITYANVFRWGGVGGNTPGALNGEFSFNSTNWETWRQLEFINTSRNGHNMMVSVDTNDASNEIYNLNLFYNLIVQRIGGVGVNDNGLKTLIINRY